jgi:hypothetical protein
MNKIFKSASILFATLSLLVIGGCSNDGPQDEPNPTPVQSDVEFRVESLEYDSVEVTITPKSDDVTYYAFLYPDTEEFMGREEVEIYVDLRWSDNFENFLTSGEQTLKFQGLVGHSYYRVVYFEFDEATGNKVGSIHYSDRIATPDAPEEIGLEISDIKGMSAKISVTPPTEDLRYFVWVYTMDSYERYQHSSDYELLIYDYSYWAYASQMYGITLEEMIEFDTNKGTKTYSTDDFLLVAEWDTEYLVWAYGVTTSGEVTTNITRRTFKTAAPVPSDMTFEVPNIDVTWYEEETAEGPIRGWRAKATIIPSNKEERYFATITNKNWYDWYFTEDNDGRSDDDYIMNQILYNAQKPSSELPTMFKSGDIEFDCFTEREILLKPDREYAVFVFGMDDNGATTSLNVYPFTTGPMPQE